jgi:hypothetical protein
MTTIDHPLLEAERVLESGFLDPAAMERVREELQAGPRTAAHMREAVFEILGPGYRACLPIAIAEVLDPDTTFEGLGVRGWFAIGPIDDSSVLEMADGDWLNVGKPDADADRAMAGFFVHEDDAGPLIDALAEGRQPVWAIPATDLVPLGTEREFRAAMDAPL